MTEKCGCMVVAYKFQYCPLHAAAPLLREALMDAVAWIMADMSWIVGIDDLRQKIRNALAAAEGK